MANQSRIFQSFGGVRQDENDYIASPDSSPDACNMNTLDGSLTVATGFSRVVPTTLTPEAPFRRLYVYARPTGNVYLIADRDCLYAYNAAEARWLMLYQLGYAIDADLFDFLELKIGSDTRLLIAYGKEPMVLWDGESDTVTSFGSAEQGSNLLMNFIELYYGRLFAAGNPNFPCRLYWSQVPGDGRTVEDWTAADANENVSGGHVDVGTDSDPITGLFALSNQLLIFKRDSLYRLLGDRPSNYRILPVDASFAQPLHTACVRYADRLYFLTKQGLYFYDGQTVRRPSHYRALYRLLKTANLAQCAAVACGDTLYFACKEHASSAYNDLLIEYDVPRDCFMLRRGFSIAGLCAVHGVLYLLTGTGKVAAFDDSTTYDGAPIDAWWTTPRIDLGHKGVEKVLSNLFCTGTGDCFAVDVETRDTRFSTIARFSDDDMAVTDVLLRGAGRVFRMRFRNVDGEPFSLDANVTALFESQLRPM